MAGMGATLFVSWMHRRESLLVRDGILCAVSLSVLLEFLAGPGRDGIGTGASVWRRGKRSASSANCMGNVGPSQRLPEWSA
jgi:hypothetical protein